MITVEGVQSLYGKLYVDGDKSVTIRAILFSLLLKDKIVINNPLISLDTIATIECVKTLGGTIENDKNKIIIHPPEKLNNDVTLNCLNSGTTARLLIGLLCGANVHAIIKGDESLSKRPFNRLIAPLIQRGAKIKSNNGFLPVEIFPSFLSDFSFKMECDSAQVKSGILLSGIFQNKDTVLTERNKTRDHTEKLIEFLDGNIKIENKKISVCGGNLKSKEIDVPGDISSCCYYLSLGLLKGEITVPNVLLTDTRRGFLDILERAGGKFSFENSVYKSGISRADITAYKSEINYFEVSEEEIPGAIDEISLIALIGAKNKGCLIKGAEELKLKESDRFTGIVSLINKAGGKAQIKDGNILVYPQFSPVYFDYESDDHRMTMTAFIFMVSGIGGVLGKSESAYISFPHFYSNFYKLNLGLIGKDVEKSLSGEIHKTILPYIYNDSFTYELRSLKDEKIGEEFINKCAYKAFNATVPYKQMAFLKAKEKSETARNCHASNFLVNKNGSFSAYNTDGKGLLMFLKDKDIDVKNKNILIQGAGGASSSVSMALLESGANVYIRNRTLKRAEDLVLLSHNKIKIYNGEKCSILINATTLKDECPFSSEEISGADFGIDINYGKKTAMMKEFEKVNKRCFDGLGMLFYQAYLSDIILLNKSENIELSRKIFSEYIKKYR